MGSHVPQHFLAHFTGFGIYWALCGALNLYWDLHCELTRTEYQPWETKKWSLLPLPTTLSAVYSVKLICAYEI